jgi:prepilin-type processing-associated H-X9-DG protein
MKPLILSRSAFCGQRRSFAFTLLELLVAIVIVTVLGGLSWVALAKLREQAQGAICSNNLRQFGAATRLYLQENRQIFFRYRHDVAGVGTFWYFGLEPTAGFGLPEGQRILDMKSGPLYPYLPMGGGVETCPAFSYANPLVKPKFKDVSFGYGMNKLLDNVNASTIESPSRVIVFGDCAYVTMNPPASLAKPMLEEFNGIDNAFKTIHFRHGTRAQFVFLDGHVESMKIYPGTLETRLRAANVGRITPVGSKEYLQ